jgi:hypothetical protein
MSVRYMIKNLSLKDKDIIIHSLNVLARPWRQLTIPPIRKLLFFHTLMTQRSGLLLMRPLGRLPLDKGAFTLASP